MSASPSPRIRGSDPARRFRSEDETRELPLFAPAPEQRVEGVETEPIGLAQRGADALASSATLVVVIAGGAFAGEPSVGNRGLPDHPAPLVLRFLAGLHGRGTASQNLADDVG